jgi:hypothetical protein
VHTEACHSALNHREAQQEWIGSQKGERDAMKQIPARDWSPGETFRSRAMGVGEGAEKHLVVVDWVRAV